MEVIGIEHLKSNKRERISGGIYISFYSLDNVLKGDYFKMTHEKSIYSFEANEIKVEGDLLLITAHEVGYWYTKLDNKDIDLRTVIGSIVVPVKDEDQIKQITLESCWC